MQTPSNHNPKPQVKAVSLAFRGRRPYSPEEEAIVCGKAVDKASSFIASLIAERICAKKATNEDRQRIANLAKEIVLPKFQRHAELIGSTGIGGTYAGSEGRKRRKTEVDLTIKERQLRIDVFRETLAEIEHDHSNILSSREVNLLRKALREERADTSVGREEVLGNLEQEWKFFDRVAERIYSILGFENDQNVDQKEMITGFIAERLRWSCPYDWVKSVFDTGPSDDEICRSIAKNTNAEILNLRGMPIVVDDDSGKIPVAEAIKKAEDKHRKKIAPEQKRAFEYIHSIALHMLDHEGNSEADRKLVRQRLQDGFVNGHSYTEKDAAHIQKVYAQGMREIAEEQAQARKSQDS